MDPVTGGAVKIQQNLFQEAQQQIQKANEQISDFEKIRQKLEEQDAIAQFQPQQIAESAQVQQAQQVNGVDAVAQLEQANEVKLRQVTEVKSMDDLDSMVSGLRNGQERLNKILSEATSGRTYSPQELIAIQAEVAKITQELELASKVVQHFVEGVKTTLNIQV